MGPIDYSAQRRSKKKGGETKQEQKQAKKKKKKEEKKEKTAEGGETSSGAVTASQIVASATEASPETFAQMFVTTPSMFSPGAVKSTANQQQESAPPHSAFQPETALAPPLEPDDAPLEESLLAQPGQTFAEPPEQPRLGSQSESVPASLTASLLAPRVAPPSVSVQPPPPPPPQPKAAPVYWGARSRGNVPSLMTVSLFAFTHQ